MDMLQLRKIIIDQKEETLPIYIIERECFKEYSKQLTSSQVKVITGVRRCGKSVLARQLLEGKKFAYINFDDEKLFNISVDDLNDVLEIFYEVYKDFQYILMDEIQNIKGWELFVNRLQRQGFNIIITGSNSNLLSKELSTHLTGRHTILELFPFSFKEFLKYEKISYNKLLSSKDSGILKGKLEEYLKIGGFPEVIKNQENYKTYLQTLYSDILTKDIIIRHNIKLSKTFRNIANNMISNTSSQVSFNKIKNIFNLKSTHTALNYISFLEESYLSFLLPKFSYKAQERIVANRKIYTIDAGIINTISINFSPNIGKIYENTVFIKLYTQKILEQSEIYYWQDINKKEVDFVIKKDNKITELIQVCHDVSNYDTKKRETSALIKAGAELKCTNLTIITGDYESKEKEIKYIPLWKWLTQ